MPATKGNSTHSPPAFGIMHTVPSRHRQTDKGAPGTCMLEAHTGHNVVGSCPNSCQDDRHSGPAAAPTTFACDETDTPPVDTWCQHQIRCASLLRPLHKSAVLPAIHKLLNLPSPSMHISMQMHSCCRMQQSPAACHCICENHQLHATNQHMQRWQRMWHTIPNSVKPSRASTCNNRRKPPPPQANHKCSAPFVKQHIAPVAHHNAAQHHQFRCSPQKKYGCQCRPVSSTDHLDSQCSKWHSATLQPFMWMTLDTTPCGTPFADHTHRSPRPCRPSLHAAQCTGSAWVPTGEQAAPNSLTREAVINPNLLLARASWLLKAHFRCSASAARLQSCGTFRSVPLIAVKPQGPRIPLLPRPVRCQDLHATPRAPLPDPHLSTLPRLRCRQRGLATAIKAVSSAFIAPSSAPPTTPACTHFTTATSSLAT
jgi:hypothetical protein